jgi:hypothetical protein
MAGISGDPYVRRYQRALGSVRPRDWSFHAHTDANQFQAGTDTDAPATRFFLRALGGRFARSKIWIDEVGAYFRDENGKVWGDQSQHRRRASSSGWLRCPRGSRASTTTTSRTSARIRRAAPSRTAGWSRRSRSTWRPGPPSATTWRAGCAPAYGVIAARGPVVAPGPQT